MNSQVIFPPLLTTNKPSQALIWAWDGFYDERLSSCTVLGDKTLAIDSLWNFLHMEVFLSIVLLMTGLTVPDPIGIPLKFLGNRCVFDIGRDKFTVSTVMAGFTVEFTVHLTCNRVIHNGISIKCIGVFLMFGIMTIATFWFLHTRPVGQFAGKLSFYSYPRGSQYMSYRLFP